LSCVTGQNMVVSVDEDSKEQSLDERKNDFFRKPEWINDLASGYQALNNKLKKGLFEAWENVKNIELGEVAQSLWNNTTDALDSVWQWMKENKEVVASAGVIIAGVGLLLIPGLEPLGLMLLANWGLSLGFGTLLNGGKVDKTVLLGAAIGGAAGAIGGGGASAFFSGLAKFAPGLGAAITGSRFLGPIINGGKQMLGKAPAFVQRMASGLFSKMGAMTATEGVITSGVDDWLRGKELNWKRAILSGLAGATLVGFASGAYPLVQPLVNKATATIEKHAGPVLAKMKPVVQNAGKCFGYQQTPRYFALIKLGNGNFIECLYAQADRGSGGGKATQNGTNRGTNNKGKKQEVIIDRVDSRALEHASLGDFTINPKTGAIQKMKGGGHGQANIDFLEQHNIAYNIVKTYPNGVRVGNVPGHKSKLKRSGMGQSWFPESWSEDDIKNAGEYVANLPGNTNVADGMAVFGEYKGVRVGVIRTNGKIGTIFPDAGQQP
jgi:Bacterial EndoU nuclease